MGAIERIGGNRPWESVFGYSRAVRAGEWLMVSGTAGTDERGLLVGTGQMYVQAHQALDNIKACVERAGLSLSGVVRTRVFVTDISRLSEVARAHRDFFGADPPASMIVEVRRLAHPDMLVEIEADVYAGDERASSKQSISSGGKASAPNRGKTGTASKSRAKPNK